MNIPCNYYKALPFIHNREEYLEKYMTRGNAYAMLKGTALRLISIEGTYIDVNHLSDIVPSSYRDVVDRYVSEIYRPNNKNKEPVNFYWRVQP